MIRAVARLFVVGGGGGGIISCAKATILVGGVGVYWGYSLQENF